MKKVFKWFALGSLALFVTIIGTSEDPAVVAIAITLWLIACIPVALILLVHASFMTYHAVKHGNPFYEKVPAPPEKIYIENGTPRGKPERKFCTICRRHTRCRTGGTKRGQVPFHIVIN